LLPGSSPVLLAHHDDPYDTPFFLPHLDDKAISPDGAWVSYGAWNWSDNWLTSYLVPANGSAPTHAISAADFYYFAGPASFTADSRRVVFSLRYALEELASAPVAGSTVPIAALGQEGQYATRVCIAPDGITAFFAGPSVGHVPADGSAAPTILVPFQ